MKNPPKSGVIEKSPKLTAELLTPEQRKTFITCRTAQYNLTDIARFIGIPLDRLQEWMRRGATEQGTDEEKALVRDYKEAGEVMVAEATATLRKAAAAGDVSASKVLKRCTDVADIGHADSMTSGPTPRVQS